MPVMPARQTGDRTDDWPEFRQSGPKGEHDTQMRQAEQEGLDVDGYEQNVRKVVRFARGFRRSTFVMPGLPWQKEK